MAGRNHALTMEDWQAPMPSFVGHGLVLPILHGVGMVSCPAMAQHSKTPTSTAFLGALSVQRAESAPRKAVDLDHFSLW